MKIATCAAVVASVAMAVPAPTALSDTVVTGEGRFGSRGTTAKAFRGDFCKTQTCTTISNRPINIDRQADLLADAVADSAGPVSVMGYSLSASAVYELVERWENEPDTAPDPERVRLVTLGNPRNQYGGTHRDEPTATPLPVGQPYEHLDVALQYDSVADKPTRWGWYSMLNASLAQHLRYDQVDIDAPENLVYMDANTTYMLVPEPVLPMLKWRDWFTSDERMAELDARYRPLVEKDYDRPDYVEQGAGADWVNRTEPPSLADEWVPASANETLDVVEANAARNSPTSIAELDSGADDQSGTVSPTPASEEGLDPPDDDGQNVPEVGGDDPEVSGDDPEVGGDDPEVGGGDDSGLHDDGVADAHGVEIPGGIVGAEIDASVTDVGIAL